MKRSCSRDDRMVTVRDQQCPKCGGFIHVDYATFWWLDDTKCANCGARPRIVYPICTESEEMRDLREVGRKLAMGIMVPPNQPTSALTVVEAVVV